MKIVVKTSRLQQQKAYPTQNFRHHQIVCARGCFPNMGLVSQGLIDLNLFYHPWEKYVSVFTLRKLWDMVCLLNHISTVYVSYWLLKWESFCNVDAKRVGAHVSRLLTTSINLRVLTLWWIPVMHFSFVDSDKLLECKRSIWLIVVYCAKRSTWREKICLYASHVLTAKVLVLLRFRNIFKFNSKLTKTSRKIKKLGKVPTAIFSYSHASTT